MSRFVKLSNIDYNFSADLEETACFDEVFGLCYDSRWRLDS